MFPIGFMAGQCYPRLTPTKAVSVSGSAANDPAAEILIALGTPPTHTIRSYANGLIAAATTTENMLSWLPGGATSSTGDAATACKTCHWSVRMTANVPVSTNFNSEALSVWIPLCDAGGGGGGPWVWQWERTTVGVTTVTATLALARSANLTPIAQTVFTITLTAT